MPSDQTGQPADAKLNRRIRDIVGDETVGNGTTAASALATALAIDLRNFRHPSGTQRIAALDDAVLRDAAADLCAALGSAHRFNLPLGTTVKGGPPGGVDIGGEYLVLVAGEPGLHAIERVRYDAHGPNLDLLLHEIEQRTRDKACRRLGLPTPFFIQDGMGVDLLRFPPLAAAGGVVLKRSVNGTGAPVFCAASREQIVSFAASIVEDMQDLWKCRSAIRARAMVVRAVAERAAGVIPGIGVNHVGVDLSLQRGSGAISMTVEYDALDAALRPGPATDGVAGTWDVDRDGSYVLPNAILERYQNRRRLTTLGADGWINEVGLALAQAAPGGMAAVLSQLATGHEARIVLPTSGSPFYARLYWHAGAIVWEGHAPGRLEGAGDTLTRLNLAIPDTVLASLPGRRLPEVADLPFHVDRPIKRAELETGELRLVLDVEDRLIDLSTGRTWSEPAGRLPLTPPVARPTRF